MKNLLIISALQLVCGVTFSQITEPEPELSPKQESVVDEKEEPVYDIVDEPADFPGGLTALREYMMENLRYPQSAVEEGISGKCYFQFSVMKDGSIRNLKLKKGIAGCEECDAEAIRMVESMPKWKPGKINGETVNSTFSLPVTFRLN
jgi:periplasmic protein TonB